MPGHHRVPVREWDQGPERFLAIAGGGKSRPCGGVAGHAACLGCAIESELLAQRVLGAIRLASLYVRITKLIG